MEIQVYLARWETAAPAVRAALEAQLPPERLERLGRAGGEKRLQAAAAYGGLVKEVLAIGEKQRGRSAECR